MTATREHWFAIEQVMSQIHSQLERARIAVQSASGLSRGPAGDSRPVERPSPASDAPARRMATPPSFAGPPVDGPIRAMEPLFGRPLEPSEATATPRAVRAEGGGLPAAVEVEREAPSDIAGLRIQIRERLTWLRGCLGDDLSAREAYNVLFPLVIHVDELTAVALGPRASDWRQLQMEFFEIDDGGELFFQKADEVMGQDDTHPLVFEVYYFCLEDGFVGRFGASPSKLEDYKVRLAALIPTSDAPVSRDRAEADEVRLVEFPRRFYLLSAAAVVVVFLLLHLLTALEVGAW